MFSHGDIVSDPGFYVKHSTPNEHSNMIMNQYINKGLLLPDDKESISSSIKYCEKIIPKNGGYTEISDSVDFDFIKHPIYSQSYTKGQLTKQNGVEESKKPLTYNGPYFRCRCPLSIIYAECYIKEAACKQSYGANTPSWRSGMTTKEKNQVRNTLKIPFKLTIYTK